MDKDKIYNSLMVSKKANVTQTKWYVIGSVVIVAMVLIFAFSTVSSVMDKALVIDKDANIYDSTLLKREDVLENTITKFTSEVAILGNTFDRISLKRNQAKLKLIVEEKSCFRLWGSYKSNNYFNDVLNRGFSCKGKFVKMISINKTELPYKVKFIGEVSVYEGSKLSQTLKYIGEGSIIEQTSQFPDTYQGWYMTDYVQNFKK